MKSSLKLAALIGVSLISGGSHASTLYGIKYAICEGPNSSTTVDFLNQTVVRTVRFEEESENILRVEADEALKQIRYVTSSRDSRSSFEYVLQLNGAIEPGRNSVSASLIFDGVNLADCVAINK
ncbi:MAG: hypothetical protein RBT63_10605 [Bdellovibrionales bacterium]|nr:hypothetical protein [Bdellovibrionales bacterium]